jgi:hypothetical protein
MATEKERLQADIKTAQSKQTAAEKEAHRAAKKLALLIQEEEKDGS